MKPRNLYRTLQMKRARKKAARTLQAATLKIMRLAWKRLIPSLRRLRKSEGGELRKQNEGWWDEWAEEAGDIFERALLEAIDGMGEAEQGWYQRNGRDVWYDPNTVLNNYRIGARIKKPITERLREQTEDIMYAAGVDRWTHETMKDEIVCELCADLDGQVFTIRDPMPPDSTHVGCRCGSAPVIPGMED